MKLLAQGYTRHNMNDHSPSTCPVPDTALNFPNMFSAKPLATVWAGYSSGNPVTNVYRVPDTCQALDVGKVVANKTANAETGNKPIRWPKVKSGVKSHWEKWIREGRKRMLGRVGGSSGVIVLTIWSGKASLRRRGEDRVMRERTVMGKGIRFWGRASDLPKTTQGYIITGQLCGQCFQVIIHNHYSNPAQ